MEPLPHHYRTTLEARPAGEAAVWSEGLPALRMSPPAQYGGTGAVWSPEHMLLAAVEACFLFTLRAVASASRLDLVDVQAETTGTVDRRDGVTRFTEITVRPTVTVAAGIDPERVRSAIEKAKRNCLISASLSTPVHLESTVVEAHDAPTTKADAA